MAYIILHNLFPICLTEIHCHNLLMIHGNHRPFSLLWKYLAFFFSMLNNFRSQLGYHSKRSMPLPLLLLCLVAFAKDWPGWHTCFLVSVWEDSVVQSMLQGSLWGQVQASFQLRPHSYLTFFPASPVFLSALPQ